EALHVGRVDLLERAVALSRVAHALCRHVGGVLPVVEEFVRRLGERGDRAHDDQQREESKRLHRRVFYRVTSSAARAAALSASVAPKTKLRSRSACCACSMNRLDWSYCAFASALSLP